MFAVKHVTDGKGILIRDPPIAQFLFQNSKAAILWLILRVYIGWDWLEHGWQKLQNPAWMDSARRSRPTGSAPSVPPRPGSGHRLRLVPRLHPGSWPRAAGTPGSPG